MSRIIAIEVVERPDPADVEVVDSGLGAFNRESSDLDTVRPLVVLGRDDQAKIQGGALGRSWGRNCELQVLWVHESHRGQGVGRQLLQHFEHEARERGCDLVYLETFTFQAPVFYRSCGYGVEAEIDGFPGGVCKLLMSKRIGESG